MNDGEAVQFPHGADIGVRGVGASRAAAFAQAATALAAAMVDLEKVAPKDVVSISCTAPNDRLLLYDWLNAVIYEMAVRRLVFCRFEVSLQGQNMQGRAWGETINLSRHAPAVEPKGATMTGLKVEQGPDGTWVAECIVDV
jgi:tRNA nucleotidyltransferase (CCA-adding enzyme)